MRSTTGTSESSTAPIAVLTREDSAFGRRVLELLEGRGVTPDLVVIEKTPFRKRLRMARFLGRKIGRLDAARYNLRFWTPHLLQALGLRRHAKRNDSFSCRNVMFTTDINSPEVAQALTRSGIERVLLGQCGILRGPIFDADSFWIVNSHPGLLPQMRGVDVVKWSLLLGEELGVTVHQVDKGVDTGPILHRETTERRPGESVLDLEKRITQRSAELLVDVGVAGPHRFPPVQIQKPEEGRQYYLMPFRVLRDFHSRFGTP